MKKNVAVFTSSRSDWGILETLVRALAAHSEVSLSILVTGSHCDERFGLTAREVEGAYPLNTVRWETGPVGDSAADATLMASNVLRLAGDWFALNPIDVVVILGDRFEALACGIAAVVHSVPIAHLHGGEVTTGAIDDSIRHALTKLARLHFPVHAEYRNRIIQLGEDPESIFTAGSLAIEGLEKSELKSISEIERDLDVSLPPDFVVCAVHPVTNQPEETSHILGSLDHAFKLRPHLGVFLTAPAPDPGFQEVQDTFDKWIEREPSRFLYRTSLGSQNFLSLISHSRGLVGNSSSGVLEVPSLSVPTLNIGSRQEGRVRALSVIDAVPNREAVDAAMEKLLSTEFQQLARKVSNPIAGEAPSREIVTRIVDSQKNKTAKLFWDLEF
jgi:UDP-hydrolysing UDP-N-acetyl-D-glucosamine 2-epimerase